MQRAAATMTKPVPPPVMPRLIRYIAIGLLLYVAGMLTLYGLYQFFFAALPAFASQGVDGKRVARLAFRDDVFGPFVAAAAIEARTAPSLLVALGVLLGYCAWVLPFEWKGVPHLVVSIFAVLQAVSHHQFLAASHPWGPLAPTPDATHMSTIMRLIYMALALAFWVLAVLSWSMAYAQQRAVASKKSE